MSNLSFVQKLDTLISTIVSRFKGVPPATGMIISTTNAGGMRFTDGKPISFFPVVTSAAEVTTARASYTQYIDVRDLTFWTKSGSTWSSTPFSGNSGIWRKNALVMSTINSRMWYLDFNNLAIEVDLTASS